MLSEFRSGSGNTSLDARVDKIDEDTFGIRSGATADTAS